MSHQIGVMVLHLTDVKGIIKFITSYADQFDFPLSGRLPNCENLNIIGQLPSHGIMKSSNKSFEEKMKANSNYDAHLQDAKKQRAEYNYVETSK